MTGKSESVEATADLDVTAGGGEPPHLGATAARTPWILGPWRDMFLFVASPLLVAPALLILSRFATPRWYFAILAFAAVGHQLACFLRVYGDRELFRRYRMRFLVGPVCMLAIATTFAYSQWSSLALILLAWGFWHVLTQQYGFVRIYDAKQASLQRVTIRLDFLMCVCWFGAGVIYSPQRMVQLLERYYLAGGALIDPLWIQAAQLAWGLLTAIVTTLFVMNYVYQRRQGQSPNPLKLMALASGIGLWWFAMVNVSELLLGIVMFELFHALQYVALVRVYGRRRLARGAAMTSWAGWLFRPGSASLLVYVGLLLLFGAPAFLVGISPYWLEYEAGADPLVMGVFALVAATTLLHFYYDGFIWRIRDEQTRRVLSIPDADASMGPAWPLVRHIPHLLKWSLLIVPAAWLAHVQDHREGPPAGMNLNLAAAVPASWQAHARLGEELLANGELEEAIQQLKQAQRIRPEAAKPHCDLGRAMRQLGRFQEALEEFQQAVTLAPHSLEAHWEYGKTLFGVGQKGRGRQHLERAMQLAPENPAIHYDLALAEARAMNFEAALRSIERAIELGGSNAEAYNARGNIYLNMKQLPEAIADYDQALELDPMLAKAYRNRAQARMANGDIQKAIADWSAAIKQDGTASRDYVIRGDLYYELGDYDKARADYATALMREQAHIEPVERMVSFLISCPDVSFRDAERAIRLAEAACRWSGFADPRALQMLADAHTAAGNLDEAIRWQQEAAERAAPESRRVLQAKVEQLRQARDSEQRGEQPKTDSESHEAGAVPKLSPPHRKAAGPPTK